jgi:hypothetical protein
MKFPVLALLAGVAPALAAQAVPTPPSVRIPRIEAEVTIDGQLDEAPWQQAARLEGFKQYRPVDARAAEDSTVVLVWYSPTAIHFGILAYDREPGSVRATMANRDNIGNDDAVTVYLDTFNDRRRAYFFGSNALGVQDDGVRSEGGFTASSMIGGTLDRSPDFTYQTKGQRTAFGYVIEMRIPFKSLRYTGGAEQTWGLNVYRINQRTGYECTWTDTRRASASFLAQSGTITGIHDIRRGVVTELQPAITFDAPGSRQPDGSFTRGDLHPDVGGNLRFGFTNLTLDGTINPDFSQVESDAGLVTLNQRFALFYPERRPFFLEGIELFAAPNNLIYTRTITNPLGGAKVTGKFGAWSVAHLSAIDEAQGGPNAFATMTRVRRDLGENSVAALTATDREQGGGHNRVLSGDTRLVFSKLYYFQGQVAASETRDSGTGSSRTAPLWHLEVDRTGRAFGFNYKLTGIDEDFSTSSGFIPRTGVTTATAFNRLSWYGARAAMLEQVTVFAGVTELWRYQDFLAHAPLEGSVSGNLSVRLRGGWNVNATAADAFTRFEPADYAGYRVSGPNGPVPIRLSEGVFDAINGSASIATPLYQKWNASVKFEGGSTPIFPEAARGHYTSASATLNLRPVPAVRLAGTLAYSRLLRLGGSEFGRSVIPRVKVEVQPNRAFFFRVVTEYRSERQAELRDPVSGDLLLVNGALVPASHNDRLRMDWLLSYQPTPGTVAFFGYGSSLQGDQPLTLRRLYRVNDGFFVKVAYLFRR